MINELKVIGTGHFGAVILEGKDGIGYNVDPARIFTGDKLIIQRGIITTPNGEHVEADTLAINPTGRYVIGMGIFKVVE